MISKVYNIKFARYMDCNPLSRGHKPKVMYLSLSYIQIPKSTHESQKQLEISAAWASMDDSEYDTKTFKGTCKYVHLKLLISNSTLYSQKTWGRGEGREREREREREKMGRGGRGVGSFVRVFRKALTMASSMISWISLYSQS